MKSFQEFLGLTMN